MVFNTVGNKQNPAVLFFHAMGVTDLSSEPVAKHLKDRYFCIMPTSTACCVGKNTETKRMKYGRWRLFCVSRV